MHAHTPQLEIDLHLVWYHPQHQPEPTTVLPLPPPLPDHRQTAHGAALTGLIPTPLLPSFTPLFLQASYASVACKPAISRLRLRCYKATPRVLPPSRCGSTMPEFLCGLVRANRGWGLGAFLRGTAGLSEEVWLGVGGQWRLQRLLRVWGMVACVGGAWCMQVWSEVVVIVHFGDGVGGDINGFQVLGGRGRDSACSHRSPPRDGTPVVQHTYIHSHVYTCSVISLILKPPQR